MIKPSEVIKDVVLRRPFNGDTAVVVHVRLTLPCMARVYIAAAAFWLAGRALGCPLDFVRADERSHGTVH
jgi:hypothetical protein